MIPINWNWCNIPVTACLLSPFRLDPHFRLYPDSPAVDPCFRLRSSTCWAPVCACLSGCAERWRSLCGAWWWCWHVSPLLDAVTARGNVWPAGCSCSSSSCNKPSTPWWVCVCITVGRHESRLIRASVKHLVNTVVPVWVQLQQDFNTLIKVWLCLLYSILIRATVLSTVWYCVRFDCLCSYEGIWGQKVWILCEPYENLVR